MTETTTEQAVAHDCPLTWLKWKPCVRSLASGYQNETNVSAIPLMGGWQLVCFESLEAAKAAWEQLHPANDFFLSTDYFQLLDELTLPDVRMGFAIFQHPEQGAFGLILQAFTFNPQQQMGKMEGAATPGLWSGITAGIKRWLARVLRFRILSAGQLLLTGEHALRGNIPTDKAELTRILTEGLEQIAAQWPERIHGVMLKDIKLDEHPSQKAYYPLPVQPNMRLELRPNWRSFDDYLADMGSKYRVRAKRARKKGEELERRELLPDEVAARQQELFALYRGIADQSDFNAVQLPEDYFTRWMHHFHSRIRMWGYFLEGELVGFYTAIYNDGELDAHFLGFQQQYNHSHQLYLNILYDLVHEGILAGVEKVVFCRTALEIKSSVGATPDTLHCWMHGRVAWANPLIPVIARFIAPLPEWEPRHPFKE